MKIRALKTIIASMLIFAMLMISVGAAAITQTKFDSSTGEITIKYFSEGSEVVITAYDPLDETNAIYFNQKTESGAGEFKFTVPETFTGETVAVKVGGSNEASSTVFVSVTPPPSKEPDSESVEMGGIYNYIAKEPFAANTITIDKINKTVYTESDFDIVVNDQIWSGLENSSDCFNFSDNAMTVNPLNNIGCEDIMIKFAPISEGTAKITFDAKLSTNGKTGNEPSYYGAVVNSETKDVAIGMARVKPFSGNTILNNTSTVGIVRFDSAKTSGKYTSYDVISTSSLTHSFEYIIDMDNKTYSISLDGAKIGTYDFYDTDIEYIDALRFSGNSSGDAAYNNGLYTVDNVVVKATQEISTHTVSFYDEDGTTLIKEISVRSNKPIIVPGAPLKRSADFLGWTTEPNGAGETASFDNITGDMTVYASYMSEVILHKVIFYDEDGTTVLYQTEVADGGTAVYRGETPTKAATSEYTYTFSGWNKSLENVTAPMSVIAQYTATPISKPEETVGTITWGDMDSDGFFNLADADVIMYAINSDKPVTSGGFVVGEVIPGTTILWGDMDADGTVVITDADILKNAVNSHITVITGGYAIGEKIEITVTK